jgi:hypothetical protein
MTAVILDAYPVQTAAVPLVETKGHLRRQRAEAGGAALVHLTLVLDASSLIIIIEKVTA